MHHLDLETIALQLRGLLRLPRETEILALHPARGAKPQDGQGLLIIRDAFGVQGLQVYWGQAVERLEQLAEFQATPPENNLPI